MSQPNSKDELGVASLYMSIKNMFHEQTRGVILSQDVDMSVSYHYRSALKHVLERRTECMTISKTGCMPQ